MGWDGLRLDTAGELYITRTIRLPWGTMARDIAARSGLT